MNEAIYGTTINKVGSYENSIVRLKGWLYNKRSSGRIIFLILRDGTGIIQCVASRKDIGDEAFDHLDRLNQESSLIIEGTIRKDSRAPGGFELGITNCEVISEAFEDYPISLKEHGVEFLLDNRHLWIRTPRQRAILTIRAAIMKYCRDFLDEEGYINIDAPILTPSACEGTTTLFSTEYFGEKAYLSQSGQYTMKPQLCPSGRSTALGLRLGQRNPRPAATLLNFGWLSQKRLSCSSMSCWPSRKEWFPM